MIYAIKERNYGLLCRSWADHQKNILNATLELIKTEGADQVTLRKITAAANVNLALVNYYFGSKDKLINEALKMLLTSFQANFTVLDDTALNPKDRLKAFMLQYVDYISQYPGLLQEVLGKGNITFESNQEFSSFLKTTGFNKIRSTVGKLPGGGSGDPQHHDAANQRRRVVSDHHDAAYQAYRRRSRPRCGRAADRYIV